MTSRSRSVLLVDWLGRGGIAHTSEAWRRTLQAQGCDVVVATRPGRELASSVVVAEHGGSSVLGRVLAHRQLARAAVREIHERRPDLVVVQNYVLPALELPVLKAAQRVGVPVALVVHDGVPHSITSGSRVGLRSLVRQADHVLAHSRFVAAQVKGQCGGSVLVTLIAHPLQLGLLGSEATTGLLSDDPRPTAIQFGVLRRRYKTASLVLELEALLHDRWRFVAAGVGAETRSGVAFDRFLEPDELVALVAAADVALLPYRWASQSGAVVLAQALGTVPIASAVGGIPEQIQSGVDGWLMPPDAPPGDWVDRMVELQDPEIRTRMSTAALRRVQQAHESFERTVSQLIGLT